MASARSSRQFARAFGLRLRVLIGGSKHYRSLEMINLDRHRATSSAPRTQQRDEVHHERLEICRPISSRRSPPVSRPKANPPRAGLRSPGEPATALDDHKFDPNLNQLVAQTNLVALSQVLSEPTGYTRSRSRPLTESTRLSATVMRLSLATLETRRRLRRGRASNPRWGRWLP